MSLPVRCASVLMIALAMLALPAEASHYRLSTSTLVSEPEQKQLATAGVDTTLRLLNETLTPQLRTRLHGTSGLTVERLEALATQCDLLRVSGVGPKMVRLLQAAGVVDVQALASQSAAGLRAQLSIANKGGHSEVLPDERTVAAWITKAGVLPVILVGLR